MINETFIRAGKAIFTVSNGKGEHYTYRIKSAPDRKDPNKKIYFVGVLNGPNNLSDYAYMGLLASNALKLILTKGSKVKAAAMSVKVLVWALTVIEGKNTLPEGYEIQHAGRCCRCGKLLTHDESILAGIGQTCAKAMGINL